MAETSLIDTMRYLGIEHDDSFDNVKMNRVNDVAKYFGQFTDGMEIVRRVALKQPKSARVDAVWEYMNTRKAHDTRAKTVVETEAKLTEERRQLKEDRRILESLE